MITETEQSKKNLITPIIDETLAKQFGIRITPMLKSTSINFDQSKILKRIFLEQEGSNELTANFHFAFDEKLAPGTKTTSVVKHFPIQPGEKFTCGVEMTSADVFIFFVKSGSTMILEINTIDLLLEHKDSFFMLNKKLNIENNLLRNNN